MARKSKNPAAKYAFIALIVALLACVATGLTGAAKGMIAVDMFPGLDTDSLDLAFNISLLTIVAGLAVYGLMVPDVVRRFLTGRQARYGSNSLIVTLAFVGILIVVNVLAHQNPTILGAPWDLTEDRSNTLSEETLQALATLPENVQATAFYTFNLSRSGAEDLLDTFKTNSKGRFDFSFVDPDQEPVRAREAGITGDGKILLEMGGRREIAAYASETELTKALIRLISPQSRVVYFLQGHGEAVIDSTASADRIRYSVAAGTLESKNYTVNTLNLLTSNAIPDDALAIIVAGPVKPLAQGEVDLLKEYLEAGGSLVVMEDPLIMTDFGDAQDPLAAYLQSDWGITLNPDMIFDFSSQQPLNAISAYANDHPITQNLGPNFSVILPQARSLGIADPAPEGVTATALLLTTEKSWGETSLAADTEEYVYDEGLDLLGPLTMLAAAENSTTLGRVVVIGNSLFASDDNFDVLGNGNIFINSVDWAAEQEDLINITPREQISRFMSPIGTTQLIIIILVAVLVLPGAFVFMGISAWLARRRRG